MGIGVEILLMEAYINSGILGLATVEKRVDGKLEHKNAGGAQVRRESRSQ